MKKFGDDWHTAEDIVEEIFVDIVREPLIIAMRPQDSFRHVLINMCMQKHKSFTRPWRRRLAERLCVALSLTLRTQDDARREIAAVPGHGADFIFLPRFCSDLTRYLPRAGRETVWRGPRERALK